jgi:CubicO group peptidase (beta-lactamase class C family)
MLATTVRPAAPAIDPREMKARVGKILNRYPAVGLALGVIRDGRLEFFYGHGVANIASNTPITEDTVFRIASITKTFTAIAVMQLWERGLVDLDAPANDYLRAYKLVPNKASFRPATLRHLLTHTSGIPEMVHPTRALRYGFGESVKLGQPLPPLGQYYSGGLRLVADPGSRFMYTDHNFATAGQIVEDVSGQPIDRYMREHIFEPLGMSHTDLNRSERVQTGLATGYNLRSRGAEAVVDRQWITAAASSIYSSPRDVARYIAALTGGGSNEHGSVLKPGTLAAMFEPQFQPDPRIPGIGLAFDRADLGGHLAVQHEGILPGFNSQIFVAPDDRIGVMAFTNGARRAMLWLPAETAQLLGSLIGAPEDAIRNDVPQHPEVWSDICGRYQLSAGAVDTRIRSLVGLGAEVFVRRGQLMLRVLNPIPALYRGFVLHPDDEKDPHVFAVDGSQFGIPKGRIVFSRDPERQTMRLLLDLMPISLERQTSSQNFRPWRTAALGVLATVVAAGIIRRRRSKPRATSNSA